VLLADLVPEVPVFCDKRLKPKTLRDYAIG
jgi:hypothetical protein